MEKYRTPNYENLINLKPEERLTVYEDERLVFSLKDGTEITVMI